MEDIVQNKVKVYIIGASHLGREIESWTSYIPVEERDWELQGFLHSIVGKDPLEDYPSDFSILGDWETFPFEENDRCIIGVSDPEWREHIFMSLKERVTIMSFIAHNVIIGKNTKIGEGTVICPNSMVSTNVNIGKACLINCGTNVGHDVELGDFCSLMANVDLGGGVKIGCKAFVGSGATVIPCRMIASNVKVGAGSVVIRNIKKEKITVFGNPAKIM